MYFQCNTLSAFAECDFQLNLWSGVHATKPRHLIFNWAIQAPFIVYFRSFQTNITVFTINTREKSPSSIRCKDSNPQSLEPESPPITTRPGLPPKPRYLFVVHIKTGKWACDHEPSLRGWLVVWLDGVWRSWNSGKLQVRADTLLVAFSVTKLG